MKSSYALSELWHSECFACCMAKRSKVFSSKAIGKVLRKYPIGSAAALLALGGVAGAFGRSGSIQQLTGKARQGIASLSERLGHSEDEMSREAVAAHH